MNLITLSYDSTNYYLIQSNDGWIMIDIGWAGTFPKLLHLLKQKDVDINEIKYLMVTHFHPDHAGLVQDIKNCGANLMIHECQISISTPGHSDDGISLVIDECCAFTGDLPKLSNVSGDKYLKVKDSWMMLKKYGVKEIYPGHGNSFLL